MVLQWFYTVSPILHEDEALKLLNLAKVASAEAGRSQDAVAWSQDAT